MEDTSELPHLCGPVSTNLDRVLIENKICKQAYRGKSFIGNHFHKYLKPETYSNICDSIISTTREHVGNNSNIVEEAELVSQKFKQLNSLYSQVHSKIFHSLPVSDADIREIDKCIQNYMTFFRPQFSNILVTPKQHLLEVHCIPFLQRNRFGLALHGEQGDEETHATISLLEKRTWGLRSEEKQLLFVMKEHMTMISPALRGSLQPMLTQRKHKNVDNACHCPILLTFFSFITIDSQ